MFLYNDLYSVILMFCTTCFLCSLHSERIHIHIQTHEYTNTSWQQCNEMHFTKTHTHSVMHAQSGNIAKMCKHFISRASQINRADAQAAFRDSMENMCKRAHLCVCLFVYFESSMNDD